MANEIKIKGFIPSNWLEELRLYHTLHAGRKKFVCHTCRQYFNGGTHYIGGGKWRKECVRCFLRNFDLKLKETYKQIAEWINYIENEKVLCEDKNVGAKDMMMQLK